MKRVVAAMVGLAFALRVLLIVRTPFMPMGDSYGRLNHPREIVKAVWLPGYQATLAFVDLFSHDVLAFRMATAMESALAVGAFALLASRFAGKEGALFVGVGMTVLPLLMFTGLYQESLFLLATSAGLYALSDPDGRHDLAAAGFLALACLTRYEAWLLVPFLWLAAFAGRRDRRRSCLLAASITSASVVAWFAFNGGRVSPMGTASLVFLETAHDVVTRARGFWHALEVQHVRLLVVAGCAMGLAVFRRAPLVLGVTWLVLLIDVAFVVIAQPYDTPSNGRIALIPSVAALWMLAIAWEAVVRGHPAMALGSGIALLAVTEGPAWSTLGHDIRSYGAATRPAGQVARGIDALGDVSVVVLANGFPAYPDAAPPECLVISAHAPHAHVTCDSSPDAAARLTSADLVVQSGEFPSWRPVHELRPSIAAWPALHSGAIAVWARAAETRQALVRWLDGVDAGQGRCATSVGEGDWIGSARADGTIVRVEPRRVALYGAGSTDVTIAHDGVVRAWVCGTSDRDGPGALDLSIVHADGGESPTEHVAVMTRAMPVAVGAARAGDVLHVQFDDADRPDAHGAAFLVGVETNGEP